MTRYADWKISSAEAGAFYYNHGRGDASDARRDPVGLTYVEGVVTGPSGVSRTVRFMVDSGAKYSLLPLADWRAIGLTPRRRMTFALADGTMIDRDVSECHIALPQGEGHTPVILGEAGDDALLGVVILALRRCSAGTTGYGAEEIRARSSISRITGEDSSPPRRPRSWVRARRSAMTVDAAR